MDKIVISCVILGDVGIVTKSSSILQRIVKSYTSDFKDFSRNIVVAVTVPSFNFHLRPVELV